MTTEALRNVHQATPFRPFSLKLAGGRTIVVNHPESMAYQPGGRTAVVYLDNGEFEIINLFLIEAIHVRNSGRRKAG